MSNELFGVGFDTDEDGPLGKEEEEELEQEEVEQQEEADEQDENDGTTKTRTKRGRDELFGIDWLDNVERIL